MTVGKAARSLLVGLLFGILALGLLPFLAIYNWAELLSLDLETSPLFMLIAKLASTSPVKSKNTPDPTDDFSDRSDQ